MIGGAEGQRTRVTSEAEEQKPWLIVMAEEQRKLQSKVIEIIFTIKDVKEMCGDNNGRINQFVEDT